MTAIYGFTDWSAFAVLCADNHTPTDPVDKIMRVSPSLVVGIIGQPFAVTVLRKMRSSKADWKLPDFTAEFAQELRSGTVKWLVPAFEEELRKRTALEGAAGGVAEWDALMRKNPVILTVLDLRDLTLNEIDFGWPLPPDRLCASPMAEARLPGQLWRFGRTAPRVPSPDVEELERDPSAVFSKLLEEDAGPGTGTVGSLVTVTVSFRRNSKRLVFKSATGEIVEETLNPT